MRALVPLLLLATPAFADMNARQQTAFDAIVGPLQAALVAQGADAALANMAPMLAECVVLNAKRRELRAFSDGDLSDEDNTLVSQIMADPKTQGCIAKAAAQ